MNLLKKIFQCHSLDPDQAQRFVGPDLGRFVRPDLGANCLPRLSADITGRQRVKYANYVDRPGMSCTP